MIKKQSLAKQSFYNVIYKGYNIIYPLITSAYISRILKASGVGSVSFAINIVTYFTMAAALGLPNYAIKALAGVRDNQEQLNKTFSELAKIVLWSSIIATGVYYLALFTFLRSTVKNFELNAILGIIIASNAINYEWLFQAVEDYKFIAVRTVIIKTFSLAFMFLTVKTKSDLSEYIWVYSLTLAANNIANGISANRYVHIRRTNLNCKKHIKAVMILFAASCATEIYTLLDSTMLGILCPSKYLGYYSNASRIVRASYGLIIAATAVYFPRLSYLYRKEDKTEYKLTLENDYELSMFLAFPAVAGLIGISGEVIPFLFGDDFTPAIFTLQMLSVLTVVFSVATVFGHTALIIYEKENRILIATIIGAIVNFTLNSFFIPRFEQNGAAFASIISECIVTTILLFSSLSIFKIRLLSSNIVKTFFASVAMFAAIYPIGLLPTKNIIKIIIAFLVGILVYALCSLLLKNKAMIMVLDKLHIPMPNNKR